MEHVVFFPDRDGNAQFRRMPSLEEAIAVVERLRNDEGVSEVSVFSLTEVPLSFRAYYRVEVPGQGAAPVVESVVPAQPPVAPEKPVALETPVALEMPVAPEMPVASEMPVAEAPLVSDEVPAVVPDAVVVEEPVEATRGLGFFVGQN